MRTKQQIIDKWKEYSTRVSYILCDDTLEDFWLNIIEEEKEALRRGLDIQLEKLKESFIEEFYQAGELWFPYNLDDEEENKDAIDSVLTHWQSIIDRIDNK